MDGTGFTGEEEITVYKKIKLYKEITVSIKKSKSI